MKTLILTITLLAGLAAQGKASLLLDGWAFRVDDQVVSFGDAVIATTTTFSNGFSGSGTVTVNPSGFNFGSIDNRGPGQIVNDSGLGTVSFRVSGAPGSTHTVTAWLDYSLGGFAYYGGESASPSSNTTPVGLEWGIDQPGYGGPGLDESVTAGQPLSQAGAGKTGDAILDPFDVSMALRLTYTLGNQPAIFSFTTQTTQPSGFYLVQQSNELGTAGPIYFSASVADATVPEPGAWALVAGGTLLLAVLRRRARKQSI